MKFFQDITELMNGVFALILISLALTQGGVLMVRA